MAIRDEFYRLQRTNSIRNYIKQKGYKTLEDFIHLIVFAIKSLKDNEQVMNDEMPYFWEVSNMLNENKSLDEITELMCKKIRGA